VLIVLTIIFEEGKHMILHAANKNTQPVVQSLFGELTVLGFLSLFTFCVTQLGFFERLSIKVFGEEEKMELLEIFEQVHFMLFGVMIFFVASVLVLILGDRRTEENWLLMDVACRSDDEVQGVADKLHAAQRMSSATKVTSWGSFLLQSLRRENFYVDLGLYCGLRNEFLLERSLNPPFEPAEKRKLGNDFNFGQYLSHCLGHNLSHVVELDDKTWAFFGILTLVYYILLVVTGSNMRIFAWVWVVTGWILLLFRNYFDYHIQNILYCMASPISFSHKQDGTRRDRDEETTPLFPSNSRLPGWTEISDEAIQANGGSRGKKLTRQDLLHWDGRDGPKTYQLLFQIQLVFTSAYMSLLILSIYPYMARETPLGRFIVFVILSLLPFGLLLLSLRRSAANMTVVCSIGIHRKLQTIAQVLREGKTEHVIRSLVLMQKLQHLAASPGGLKRGPESSNLTLCQEIELADARKIFRAMDKSGDGQLHVEELSTLMKKLGAPTTDDSFQAIVKMLDPNEDGIITLEEFLSFYQCNIRLNETHHLSRSLHELAHQIFAQFDRDNSHSVALSEFKDVIDSFNVDFTIDELGELINEIDHDNTGSIGVHEFEDLLHNHRHLFQAFHLPQLPIDAIS
jgi:Ca2+-binding EF-hand superfamily protein